MPPLSLWVAGMVIPFLTASKRARTHHMIKDGKDGELLQLIRILDNATEGGEETSLPLGPTLLVLLKRLSSGDHKPTSSTGGPDFLFPFSAEEIYRKIKLVVRLHLFPMDGASLLGSPASLLRLNEFSSLVSLSLEGVPMEHCDGLWALRGQLKTLNFKHGPLASVSSLLGPPQWNRDTPEMSCRDPAHDSKEHFWSKLETLLISNCGLSEMDSSLSLLPAVKNITIANHRITRVEQLENCQSLEELDLRRNSIASLIGISNALGNIQVLNLSKNRIFSLEGLSDLVSLKSLDLSFNFVDKMEEVVRLSSLPNLEVLKLIGTPVTKVQRYRMQVLSLLWKPSYVKENTVTGGFELDGQTATSCERMELKKMIFPSTAVRSLAADDDTLSSSHDDSLSTNSDAIAVPEPANTSDSVTLTFISSAAVSVINSERRSERRAPARMAFILDEQKPCIDSRKEVNIAIEDSLPSNISGDMGEASVCEVEEEENIEDIILSLRRKEPPPDTTANAFDQTSIDTAAARDGEPSLDHVKTSTNEYAPAFGGFAGGDDSQSESAVEVDSSPRLEQSLDADGGAKETPDEPNALISAARINEEDIWRRHIASEYFGDAVYAGFSVFENLQLYFSEQVFRSGGDVPYMAVRKFDGSWGPPHACCTEELQSVSRESLSSNYKTCAGRTKPSEQQNTKNKDGNNISSAAAPRTEVAVLVVITNRHLFLVAERGLKGKKFSDAPKPFALRCVPLHSLEQAVIGLGLQKMRLVFKAPPPLCQPMRDADICWQCESVDKIISSDVLLEMVLLTRSRSRSLVLLRCLEALVAQAQRARAAADSVSGGAVRQQSASISNEDASALEEISAFTNSLGLKGGGGRIVSYYLLFQRQDGQQSAVPRSLIITTAHILLCEEDHSVNSSCFCCCGTNNANTAIASHETAATRLVCLDHAPLADVISVHASGAGGEAGSFVLKLRATGVFTNKRTWQLLCRTGGEAERAAGEIKRLSRALREAETSALLTNVFKDAIF